MPNNWIEHIKDFASKNNLSFGCALSNPECVKSYRQKKEPKKKPINEENEANKREAQSIYNEYTGRIMGHMIIGNMKNKTTRFPKITMMELGDNRNAYKRLTGKDLPSIEAVKKGVKKADKQYEKNEKLREQKLKEQPINTINEYDLSSTKFKKKKGLLL